MTKGQTMMPKLVC